MRSLILYAWIAFLAASSGALAGDLKAGVARVDLTPPLEMKATLGGYGARMSKPAVGVHDRVFAKALVLSDGPDRFALVTADVLAFPPGPIPAAIGRRPSATAGSLASASGASGRRSTPRLRRRWPVPSRKFPSRRMRGTGRS